MTAPAPRADAFTMELLCVNWKLPKAHMYTAPPGPPVCVHSTFEMMLRFVIRAKPADIATAAPVTWARQLSIKQSLAKVTLPAEMEATAP
mmetsp:Transcript_42710/g.125307  ORF Transcript_42710/g.125307 Transcript_42710/m.125307 type:complete len:90 (+) Transcript_42710:5039-5308(+)